MLLKRLRDKKGYTLTELLCVLAILVIVSALLTTGIKLALDAYSDTTEYAQAQTLAANLTGLINDELRYAKGIDGVTYRSPALGRANCSLCLGVRNNDGSVTESGSGEVFIHSQVEGEDKYNSIIGSGSYTDNCVVSNLSVTYASSVFSVSFSVVNAQGQVLSTAAFQVKPLNS